MVDSQRVSGAELAIAVSYPKNNCLLERRENKENVWIKQEWKRKKKKLLIIIL